MLSSRTLVVRSLNGDYNIGGVVGDGIGDVGDGVVGDGIGGVGIVGAGDV